MLKAVKASLAFMTPKERSKWYFLTGLRALLSVLDLAGILAIGFVVTSTAIFLTAGSDPNRVLEFAGLQIPAVNAQSLPWVSAVILVMFLAKALFSLILTKKAAFFVAKIEARSAKTIAEISFGGDLGDARKRSREEMMYAIQTGSPAAFNYLLNSLGTIIAEATLFMLICLGFLVVNPGATLAAVIYFGAIGFAIQYFVGTLMEKAGSRAAKGFVQANTAVSDLIAVFRELSVLGLRHKYIDRVYQSRIAAADSSASQYYLGGMPRYVVEAALLVGVAGFVLVQALTGDIIASAATIGVFLSGGFRLTAAMLPLQSALLTIKGAIPNALTALDILATSKSVIESGAPSKVSENSQPRQDSGRIEAAPNPVSVQLSDVNFSFPGSNESTLDNISLEIAAGSQVALIGASGAGKSTIADLICGILSPTAGTVLLRPESELLSSSQPIAPAISYVPQKPGLVSGSIAENVALAISNEEVDTARVLSSLQRAHLKEVIEALPDGIHTNLGKLQDGLSGGQIQRLGLARALYSNPGLLVMDEATSALDAESESEIQKALSEMRGKVTVVLIAHRLNTIQHADQVFLVDQGKIVDSGSFKELVKRNPSVERLVELMRVDPS